MPIAVTHLITGLDVGGAETQLARLVTRSDATRFHHRVICLLPPGPVATQIAAAGVPVQSMGVDAARPDPRALYRLARLVQQQHPNVLQAWMFHANLLASLIGPVARAPVVWNMRAVPDVDYGRQIAMINGLLGRMARWPAAVVGNSEHGREYLSQHGYGGARWLVIPNGFDTGQFRPDPGARRRLRHEWQVDESTLVIGLAGRLDPVKGHPTFLQAARQMLDTAANARFVCAGGGPEPYEHRLRAMAHELGIEDAVLWLGPQRDMASFNAALDIATCSSLSESFPNVVGEAMACAVPCVVTDVGDSALLVGDTGRVVPPGDAAALAEGWRALFNVEAPERQRLGELARARIEARFSLDAVVREYEALYVSLASVR